MQKRALAYIRVSTDGQAQDGISLDAQRARIKAYCECQDYELVGVFADAGLSGSTLDRPQLQEALALLRQKRADVLVVLKLDRLSRSTRHILDLADRCQREGWALVSLSENLDTSSAAGRFVLTVLGSLAQLEREQTVERTKLAMRHLRNTHKRVGEIRFGYSLADDGKSLIPNDAEQATITKLVLLRQRKRLGFQIVANLFNALHIKTKYGGRWHARVLRNIYNANIGDNKPCAKPSATVTTALLPTTTICPAAMSA